MHVCSQSHHGPIHLPRDELRPVNGGQLGSDVACGTMVFAYRATTACSRRAPSSTGTAHIAVAAAAAIDDTKARRVAAKIASVAKQVASRGKVAKA